MYSNSDNMNSNKLVVRTVLFDIDNWKEIMTNNSHLAKIIFDDILFEIENAIIYPESRITFTNLSIPKPDKLNIIISSNLKPWFIMDDINRIKNVTDRINGMFNIDDGIEYKDIDQDYMVLPKHIISEFIKNKVKYIMCRSEDFEENLNKDDISNIITIIMKKHIGINTIKKYLAKESKSMFSIDLNKFRDIIGITTKEDHIAMYTDPDKQFDSYPKGLSKYKIKPIIFDEFVYPWESLFNICINEKISKMILNK